MDRFQPPAQEKTFEDTMNWDDRQTIRQLDLSRSFLQGALASLAPKAKEVLQDAWGDAVWTHLDYHFGPDRRDAAIEYFNDHYTDEKKVAAE